MQWPCEQLSSCVKSLVCALGVSTFKQLPPLRCDEPVHSVLCLLFFQVYFSAARGENLVSSDFKLY